MIALSEVAYSLIGFFMNPLNAGILIVSLALALVTFIYWKEKSKISLIYLHLFFLIFPLLYYAVMVPCSIPFIQGLVSLCSIVITRLLIFLIPTALAGAVAVGYFVAPLLYRRIYKAKEIKSRVITANAKRFGIKNIRLYLADTAKPVAFALKSAIFVSVGMFELLSRKELEAVLLHELGHIHHKSSLSKFSLSFFRIFSPLSRFAVFKGRFFLEEEKADAFAVKVQGTSKFLVKAKERMCRVKF